MLANRRPFDRAIQGDSELVGVLHSIRWPLECLWSTRSSSRECFGLRWVGNEDVPTISRGRHVMERLWLVRPTFLQRLYHFGGLQAGSSS